MDGPTSPKGLIVLHGSRDGFVRESLAIVPNDADAAILVVGEAAAGLEYGGRAVAPANPAVFLAQRAYATTLEDLEAALAPFGDSVVAVVEGVRGAGDLAVAHAVKRAGGAVIATAFAGAKADRAAFAFVDLFLPLADVASAVREILEDPFLRHDLADDEQLRAFLRIVRQRTGIDFSHYKPATISRRVQRSMIAAKVTSLSEFSRYLQQHPEQYGRLVHEFLIKVTDFFRDDELFEYLRSEILPEIVQRARDEKRELRVWSAGCATGEEAFSLAILLAELVGDRPDAPAVKIFATDLDDSAIAFARLGIYPQSSLGAMPPEWIERHFTPNARGFEVRKRIRNMTVFGQHDLGQRAPFPRIDLVLCRNVLIYFTKELQQRTLQLFAFSLREGGYLVLGKSETLNPAPEFYRGINTPYRIFQRYGERVLIPPPRTREPYAVMRAEGPAPNLSDGKSRAAGDGAHAGIFERVGIAVFNERTGYLIVDRRYDIVAVNTEARRLLGIFGLGIGEDLIHLVQGAAAGAIRTLVDAALRGEEGGADLDLSDAPLAARHRLFVTARPERSAGGDVVPGAVIVRVEDVTDRARERESAANALAARDAEIVRLTAQQRRVTDVRDAFAVANQELAAANVELRAVNERLLISIEEAEASSEEIETLNEEMQATNEELETLNEELQATIEELNTTNDELHVRGLELQGAIDDRERAMASTGDREGEFSSIFSELPFGVAHYTIDGRVDKMNDAFLALLERYGDPLPLRPLAGSARSPLERVAGGESFEEVWQLGEDGTHARFLVRSKRLATDGRGSLVVLIPHGD